MAISLVTGRPGAGKSYEAVAFNAMPALETGRRLTINIPLDLPVISTVLGRTITGTSWQLPTAKDAAEAAARVAAGESAYADLPKGEELAADDKRVLAHVSEVLAAKGEAERELLLWDELAAQVRWFPSDVWRVPPRPSARTKSDAYDVAAAVRRLWFLSALDAKGTLFVLDEVWRLWPSGMRQDVVPAEERQFLAEHRHKTADGHSQEIALLVQSRRNISSWPHDLVDHWVDLRKLNKIGVSQGYRATVWDGLGDDRVALRKEVRRYEPRYWRCYQSATGHTTTSVPVVTRDGITFEAERWQIGMKIETATASEDVTDSRATLWGGGRGWRMAGYAALALAAVVALFAVWLSGGGLAGSATGGSDDPAALDVVPGELPSGTTSSAAGQDGEPPAVAASTELRNSLETLTESTPPQSPPPPERDAGRKGALAELVAAFDGRVVLEPSWWTRIAQRTVAGRTFVRRAPTPARLAMCAGDDCGRLDLAHVDHVRFAECIAQVGGRLVLCGQAEAGGAQEADAGEGLDFGFGDDG